MSWDYDDWRKLCSIEENQHKQIENLVTIIRKQDREIALLEGILRALEREIDDGR
jgi:hypothetical protein